MTKRKPSICSVIVSVVCLILTPLCLYQRAQLAVYKTNEEKLSKEKVVISIPHLDAILKVVAPKPAKKPPTIPKDYGIKPIGDYEIVLCNVSAYCPCSKCCGKWAKLGMSRKLPSGVFLQQALILGAVAAPKHVPFFSKVSVPGYFGGKPVQVLDRGGAIKGRGNGMKLDLLFRTHEEALEWGRQMVYVTFYKK